MLFTLCMIFSSPCTDQEPCLPRSSTQAGLHWPTPTLVLEGFLWLLETAVPPVGQVEGWDLSAPRAGLIHAWGELVDTFSSSLAPLWGTCPALSPRGPQRLSSIYLPTVVTGLIIISVWLLQEQMLNQSLGTRHFLGINTCKRKAEKPGLGRERSRTAMQVWQASANPQGAQEQGATFRVSHSEPQCLPLSVPGRELPWEGMTLGDAALGSWGTPSANPNPCSWAVRPSLKGALGTTSLSAVRTHHFGFFICHASDHPPDKLLVLVSLSQGLF